MAVTVDYFIKASPELTSTTLSGFAGAASAGTTGSAILSSIEGSSTVDIMLYDQLGELITTVSQAGSDGALCTLASGAHVAVTDDGTSIFCAIIAADGESMIPVALADPGDVSNPAVTALSGGGFAVAYQKNFDGGSDSDLRISVRAADGSLINIVTVDSSLAKDQVPAVAALDGGGIAIAWQRVVNGATHLWYAVYDAAGNTVKAPTKLDDYGTVNANPTIVGTADGGFAIAYEDDGWTGADIDISLARFTADGTSLGIVDASKNDQDDTAPVLTRLSNGMLMLGSAHQEEPGDRDILLSLIGDDNEILAQGGRTINTDEFDPGLAALANGHFNLVYTDPGEGGLTSYRFNAVRYSDGDDAGDTVNGDSLEDNIQGWGGSDILRGWGGDDHLHGGTGTDQHFGGAGDDTMDCSAPDIDNSDPASGEIFHGGTGFDTIRAFDTDLRSSQLVSIEGLEFTNNYQSSYFIKIGADQFGAGLATGLTLIGDTYPSKCVFDITMGSSTSLNLSKMTFEMWGPEGDQILVRGDGAVETIVGSSAVDHMLGGGGGDKLIGGGGKDILRGGLGDDVYTVNVFGEAIELAGQGNDLVRSFVSYTLGTDIERLTLIGSNDIAGNGNALGNVLIGNAGGNLLNGRGGKDQLTGGEGADGFLFTGVINAATNADRVEDFEVGIDTLQLDDAIFAGLTNANKAGAFHVGASAADADDRIIYNAETGAIFFDADGKGGQAQVRFATLDAGLDLQATDIVII